MRCSVTGVVVLGGLLFGLAACGDSGPPTAPRPDGGNGGEGGVFDPFADTDGDGLCDGSEEARGFDPENADTDGDGFPDYVEWLFGFDALRPASPDRALLHVLREQANGEVTVPITLQVFGEGEDFLGAFEGLPARDAAGSTAAAFYVDSRASFAKPSGNAASVDEEGETFFDVDGVTELGFEVFFGMGDNPLRRCTRLYPFRYNIKRSDGVLVGAERLILAVIPPGDTYVSTEWCAPPEPCF